MKINIDTIEAEISANNSDIEFIMPDSLKVNIVNEDDLVLDSYQNRECLPGKNDLHSLQVRSMSFGNILNIQGAFFAFLFGQNVFTASKPKLLVKKVLGKVFNEFDFNIPEKNLKKFYSGDVKLKRIDLAVNYRFNSQEEVTEALSQIKRQLVELNCTVRTYDKNVILSPQNGREYSISFYAKGPQMRRMRKYDKMNWAGALLSECSTILRVEIRVRSQGLRKMGLEVLSNWKDGDSEILYQHYFRKLPNIVITSLPLEYEDLSKLPSRLKPVFALHKTGVDIARVYKKTSLDRHKRWFKQRGVNLSKPNHALKVVPLKELISPKNAIIETPEWMREMGLFPKRPMQLKPLNAKRKNRE